MTEVSGSAAPKVGDRVTLEGVVISHLSGGKEVRVRLTGCYPYSVGSVVSMTPEALSPVEPDEVCLREVEVTYGTFVNGPTPESHVLCLRPLPCNNPHHKPERPTYGTR